MGFGIQGAPMAVAAAWLQVQSPRRRRWGRRFCRCCNWVANDGAMMWKETWKNGEEYDGYKEKHGGKYSEIMMTATRIH